MRCAVLCLVFWRGAMLCCNMLWRCAVRLGAALRFAALPFHGPVAFLWAAFDRTCALSCMALCFSPASLPVPLRACASDGDVCPKCAAGGRGVVEGLSKQLGLPTDKMAPSANTLYWPVPVPSRPAAPEG